MKQIYFLTSLFLLMLCISKKNYAQVAPGNAIHKKTISQRIVSPLRITCDPEGNAIVSDSYLNKIVKFDTTGNIVAEFQVSFCLFLFNFKGSTIISQLNSRI